MKQNILPKTIWGFYWQYAIKKYWKMILLFSVFFFLCNLFEALYPLTQKWFVALFEAKVPAGMTLMEYATPTLILIYGIYLSGSIVNAIAYKIYDNIKPKINQNLSEVLTDYVQKQSISFWTGRMSGKVSSQMNYIERGFDSFKICLEMFFLFIMLLFNTGLILTINKYIALILGVMLIIRISLVLFILKRIKSTAKAKSDVSSSLSGKIIDSISNYSIVKLFAGEKKEQQYLNPYRKDFIKKSILAAFFQRISWIIPSFIWDIGLISVLILGVYFYSNGQMSLSDIVLAMAVYHMVMSSIAYIMHSIPDITDTISSAVKSYDDLVCPITITDDENATDLVVKKGKIELENVSFKYRNKYVLDGLNLTIKAGEKVGIVGPSGAGKTTLVNLIMRFYDSNKGHILIDKQDVKKITQQSLRENISFIPQEPTLFNRTIRENIAYGDSDASDKAIKSAAKKASADSFIMATEKKYDSLVGERGIKLSGGQKQRIAISRAFLKDAPILILDEATSALDSETELAIQDSFKELSKGRTTIAIAHRLSTLRNMDRIIVLKDGHIVEQGSHNSLLRKKGEYYSLWKMQSGGFLPEE